MRVGLRARPSSGRARSSRSATGAARDAIRFLERERGLSRDQAYNLCSLALDLRISQVVDGLKGVHAMLPKAIFTDRAPTFRTG